MFAFTKLMQAMVASGSVSDPQFYLTTLLLSGDGTNGAQNNTFLDSSSNAFSITRNGNTTQGTFSPFSQTGWSNYFDGINSYVTFASANTANAMGSGDWTIEAWIYPTTSGTDRSIFDTQGSGGSNTCVRIRLNTTNQLTFTAVGSVVASGGSVPANTWTHIAVCKASGSTRLFVNGVQVGTTYTDGNTYTCGASRPVIGIDGFNLTDLDFVGYVSNLRTVKGQALYTGTFTPSTSPLTTTSQGVTAANVSLLTCQSNSFIDNSNGAFVATAGGTPSVQAFSPFAPTAAYSTSVVGGSGYFDGSGDYLTAANNAAFQFSGAFTIEMWVYPSQVSSRADLVCTPTSPSSASGIYFFINSSAAPFFGSGAASFITSSRTVSANTWTHIALTRDASNVATIWVNGVSGGTATVTQNFSDGNLYVGTENSPSNYFNGYMSGVRIVKGTAVYTSSFTPPTAPLTAITNTSLLLNFTNGGITDATAKNDLETVGNAQISTTQSKFGGSSMYFDGTGDYLLTSANQAINAIGTGDFTIEAWVNFSALSASTASVILDFRPSTTAGAYPTIYISTAYKLMYDANSANRITGTTTFSTGTWYHIAIVRYSGSTKMYVNGSNEGSAYTDSTNYLGSTNRPVVGADGYTLGSQAMNGYIDDLRISRYARYTANFSVPTAAFPVQ